MNIKAMIIAGAGLGLLYYFYPRPVAAAVPVIPTHDTTNSNSINFPEVQPYAYPVLEGFTPPYFPVFDNLINSFTGIFTSGGSLMKNGSQYPRGAGHYSDLIRQVELANGIPSGLLYRLIEKESAFDPSAYNSKVGASGIAQIVPKWHPGVDVWNPFEAIPYAGKYLKQNYVRFNDWGKALAAYNWGPTNVQNSPADLSAYPAETRNYVTVILSRAGVGSVLV